MSLIFFTRGSFLRVKTLKIHEDTVKLHIPREKLKWKLVKSIIREITRLTINL